MGTKKKREREKKPPEVNEPKKGGSPTPEPEKDPWHVAEEVRDIFGHNDDDKHLD